ncbi:peptidoglycan-binding protein, partial [Oscillatoriales cyanobacterium LEGE 11467]
FQAAWGLKVDGVVGTRTLAALKAARTYAIAVANGSNGTSSTRVWKKGEAGQFVRQTKQRLNDFGYTAGNPTAFAGEFFDTRMENAVKRFQKDKGLNADGRIGPQTQQILYAFEYGLPTVKLGDSGALVQMVQYQLGMVPMGEFDGITVEKVKVFQAEQGLVVTGVVDARTHQVLGTHRARLMLAAMD